jgi:hypothetical protein
MIVCRSTHTLESVGDGSTVARAIKQKGFEAAFQHIE